MASSSLTRYMNLASYNKLHLNIKCQLISNIRPASSQAAPEFQRLQLITKKDDKRGRFSRLKKGFVKTEMMVPRYKQMPIDQSWMSVWPTAQSFRPSVVPLPLRQGYSAKDAPPGKFANAELMKIPNFLHLTPPAIETHCAALKKFCTDWPKELKSDAECEKYFPMEVVSSDYCHASPSIRDPKSRIVTIKIKLSDLKLDYHARDKYKRLVGDKYDPKSDIITIVTDRCPLRKQNYDFAMYVLTALFHESKRIESWEAEKTEDDMEAYFWEKSRAQNKICALQKKLTGVSEDEIRNSLVVKNYGQTTETLYNEKETKETIENYKKASLAVLGIL